MSDNTNANVLDDIMNIAGPDTSTPVEPSEAGTVNGSDGSTETSEGSDDKALYPKVLRTYSADEIAAGTNPDGCLTVAEFAATLTFREYSKGNSSLSAFVQTPSVYQALKAKRHPIPVVLVLPADSTDPADARVFIPEVEGLEAWDSRPARGTGADSAASTRSQEDLLNTAAKKVVERDKIQARLERAQEQLKKAESTVSKYQGWLAQFYSNDRDAASAAMLKAAEQLVAESESDSAIDDNGNPVTE